MFKTRKIIQLSQHSTTARTGDASRPKYGINPLRKQLKLNQYAIHAKSIIQQLNEQHELGVLKNQMIWNKNKQVLELLSKCTSEVRCQLFIKLVGFYSKIKAKFSKQSFSKFDQILSYVMAICESNEKKFCQLILLQRIDELLIYIFKTFPENRDDVYKKVKPIIKKMKNIQQKIKNILPKKDYELFTICLSYWKLQTKEIKKQQAWDSLGRASVATVNSQINEKQNEAEERLKSFDLAIQTQQFKKHLQSLNRKKKTKIYTRSSTIRQASCKRISTTWGKQESQHSINNTDIIKKGQGGMGCSKFNSSIYAPRKSISTFKKEDSSTDKISEKEAKKRVSIYFEQGFQPFYFFAIIKGNIRIITVQKAEIIQQTNKLKVHLSGYFCYPLIFHKFHSIFNEKIRSQTLKKFILAKTHLKQNKMWKILVPKKKIQKDNIENEHKNLICQLLQQNQKFNFNGFYKKYNVYFFTKYESQNKKSKQGTLIVYDNVFDDKLETIPITNWKFRQSVDLSEDIPLQQKYYSQQNKRISISDHKLREKTEKIKILKLNKAKNRFSTFYERANQKNNNFLLTIKNQGKFVVLTQNITKNKISLSNLNSQFRYQSLFSVSSPNRREISRSVFSFDVQNRQRDKLLQRLNRKRESSTRTILNRRVGKPQYVQIRYELCFLKKVKDLGFAMCRLFILKPDQGQIILSQVYLSQNQKYYVFAIKPASICNIALFDINNISNQVLHDRLTYLIKKIEIVKISGHRTQSGQFGLALQLGQSLNLQGSQLFYRECISDQKLNPLLIDSLFLSKSQITNKEHVTFELSRQVYQLGKKLYNYKSETLKIQDYSIVKKYIKYYQFLKCLKEYTKKILKNPSQLFHKNKNQYYYLCKSKKKKNEKIIKIKIASNQWEFVEFAGQDASKIKINDWEQKFIVQKLNRNQLNIYLKRLVKDPLLYKLKMNSMRRL